MQISELLSKYDKHPQLKTLGDALSKSDVDHIHMEGAQGSAAAVAFAALAHVRPKSVGMPLLFVLGDAEEAGYFYHDLVQMLSDQQVFYFPASYRREVRFGQRDSANEILRTEVLGRLSAHSGQPLFVVTYPDALSELVVTRQELVQATIELRQGARHDIAQLEEQIQQLGFQRTDYVYEPGQYAVRGSILDIYSFSYERPYRVDFFDDEIDSIRTFDIQTQLSLEKKEEVQVVPEFKKRASGESFLSFVPRDTAVVCRHLPYLKERIRMIWEQGFSSQALMQETAEQGTTTLDKETLLVKPEAFDREVDAFRLVETGTLTTRPSQVRIRWNISPQPEFHKNFDLISGNFLRYMDLGYTLCILADSPKQNERLKDIFDSQGQGVRFTPVDKTLHSGFADNTLRLCLFTDHQIFDRYHKYNLRSDPARQGKMALTLKELRQFEIGDYVVHIDHGVGRFGGLVTMPENGQMQEKIKIIYQNDDVVFVSIHALHKVSKYKGKEGEPPKISRLGGGAWERLKERTKSRMKDIARDLIKLYSARQKERGFQFSPDSFLQNELEASFLYEDTPDQQKATQDVKADMERVKPMDRLVCGDVGFGKTEVAIRAAFKACCDNKQVAVLVPTTVLAHQHYRTFCKRLKNFSVRVEYLSRARTAKQTKEVLAALEKGEVNILVGTHKLLGKTVKFHDLGLLIVDEEQKFGVSTKEKLRQMRTNVDTLTLTATPIPRTLQFSLMGARDLSVIQTPPPNRHPIQTEVHTFDAQVIADAIQFEMSRNGQVYLINNRISNLPELEALVHKYVPDARVAVGHGRMPSEQLEEIVIGFANYDYDVLIATTIVESGIDIPNANTIIINGAQNFGLSDLHQMRGRVGRSNKKAFCYLLAPPLSGLSNDARRRLQAIENFSDLGSGIHIAMQDLDIRGAGNLLGAEQSGFIADLGYETYQKILAQAVKELRNDEFQELYAQQMEEGEPIDGQDFVEECQLDSDIPMLFPESYVPGSSERMLLYRELDGLQTDEQIEQFRKRMVDRFGPIPPEGEELIRVVALRHLGMYFGAERIVLKQGRMRLVFVQNDSSPFFQSQAFGQIIAFASTNVHRCRLEEKDGRRSLLVTGVKSVEQAVALLRQMQQVKAV